MAVTSAGRIVSVGARAGLGLNALQVAMNVRAGLSEPRACRFRDARGRQIGMSRVGGLGGDCFGYDRLLSLAAPALAEALRGRDVAGVPLVLALPSRLRPDHDPRLAESFAAALIRRAGVDLDAKLASVIQSGHAGGVDALCLAHEQLAAGTPAVVVGGVDSYYHPDVLRWLDGAYRLHALGVEDGFIPAEGAAFVLLESRGKANGAGVVSARLLSAQCVPEPAMLDDTLPNIAEGLTALVARLGGTSSPWVMHDVNGEHRRQREWRMVALRHALDSGHVTRLPDELGDIGAATAPMMAAIATTWWQQGCAPAARALLLTSSETEQRAAAVLEEVSA